MKTYMVVILALLLLMTAFSFIGGLWVNIPENPIINLAYSVNQPDTLAIKTILFSKFTLILVIMKES